MAAHAGYDSRQCGIDPGRLLRLLPLGRLFDYDRHGVTHVASPRSGTSHRARAVPRRSWRAHLHKDRNYNLYSYIFTAATRAEFSQFPSFPGNFQQALEQFDTDGDGLIDRDEFRQMNQRYPMVLFPMFHLQDKMQRCTLGERRWTQIMKQQYKLNIIRDFRYSSDLIFDATH